MINSFPLYFYRSSANIGCEVCARKETDVNFYTNMIWQKCLSAIFTLDLVSVNEYSVYHLQCCDEYKKTKLFQLNWTISFVIIDACHNKECPFLHIDPESKIRDCPWYDRGFCRHGPSCRHRHVRRELCLNYLAGFCPSGPECPNGHPRFEIPVSIKSHSIYDWSIFRNFNECCIFVNE